MLANEIRETTKAILNISQGLADVNRYSQISLVKDESVLEHIGFCSVVSYIIGTQMINLGEELDIGKLLTNCAVHDIEEFMTGDIPRTMKHYNDSVKNRINEVAEACVEELSMFDFIIHDWKSAKDETKEGFFMKCIDMSAVVCKAHAEVVIKGNKSMIWHVTSNKEILDHMKNKASNVFVHSDPMTHFLTDLQAISKHIKSFRNNFNYISVQSMV